MTSKFQASKQLHAIRKQLILMDQQYREGFQTECTDSSSNENTNETASFGSFDIIEEVCLLPRFHEHGPFTNTYITNKKFLNICIKRQISFPINFISYP